MNMTVACRELCSLVPRPMSKDVGMVIRIAVLALVAFWGFHPYMFSDVKYVDQFHLLLHALPMCEWEA